MFDRQAKIKIFITALIFLLVSPVIYAEEKIIFAVTLIRHGDRTALHEINGVKPAAGLGELTPLGMHQEYLLGKQMRERYINQLHLLPSNYHSNSIYVLATPYSRTLMSAESFLLGFYPPGTGPKLDNNAPALPYAIQPVPIYVVSEEQADFLLPKKTTATLFFSKLTTDLQLAAAGKQLYRYILYSGHDTSILKVMTTLGSPPQNKVPYASYISFELYQNGANFRVKVWYNGEPVRLTRDKDNKTTYTLEEFLNMVKS